MERTFISALENGSIDELSIFEKSDLHSHAGRGGNVKYIAEWTGEEIALPPQKFTSLSDMQKWYSDNIRCLAQGKEGQIKRWEACFRQAAEDNIAILALSFSTSEIELVGGMDVFIKTLTDFRNTISPATIFLPELTYDRACNVEKELFEIENFLSYGYFKSIDICCNEFAQPIKNFKQLYQKAKNYGLRLKAHVGEFGTADDVMEAVEELELNEVHHGIAAAKSIFIMNWLAHHKIQLNICPTSNVMLGIVDEYQNHPIEQLYHAGIPITINTDDLLIFNQTISQEYLNLYSSGTLNADELEHIRLIGLNEVIYYTQENTPSAHSL